MEMTKKEFYKKYAGGKTKARFSLAVGFSLLCIAVFYLLPGKEIYQNHGIPEFWAAVDMAVLIVCGLGAGITLNRVLSVFLLIYGCAVTLVLTIQTGVPAGFWLILAGVYATQATFCLHNEYQRFLESGEMPQASSRNIPRNVDAVPLRSRPLAAPEGSIPCSNCGSSGYLPGENFQMNFCPVCGGLGYVLPGGEKIGVLMRLKTLWRPVFLPMLLIFAGLFIAMEAAFLPQQLFPLMVNRLETPMELLRAYSAYYGSWLISLAAGGVLMLLFDLLIWRHYRNSCCAAFIGLVAVLYLGAAAVMLIAYDIPSLWRQGREDAAQGESSRLETVTVWLHPRSAPASLSGPFPADEEKPFTLYSGISEETDEEWELFYIPNNLGFSLDADALYQENKSVSWNEQYARQYQIHYTTNFHFVFSVEPAD